MTKRLVCLVGGVVLALGVLAGCGSDDGDDTDAGGSDTNTSDNGGTSDDGGSSDDSGSDYCAEIAKFKSAIGDISPNSTLADLQSQADSMAAAADLAPDEVSDSWDTLADSSASILSALQNAGVKPEDELRDALKSNPEAAKAMSEAGKELAGVDEDADKISREVKDDCDIDLGADPGAPQ